MGVEFEGMGEAKERKRGGEKPTTNHGKKGKMQIGIGFIQLSHKKGKGSLFWGHDGQLGYLGKTPVGKNWKWRGKRAIRQKGTRLNLGGPHITGRTISQNNAKGFTKKKNQKSRKSMKRMGSR